MYMGGHFQYSPMSGSPLFLDTQDGCTSLFPKSSADYSSGTTSNRLVDSCPGDDCLDCDGL